ncbi:MAG TPA: Asp-tRNA(Asn)/Glu-tRNA(Gln) amidotransferase subunit GatC [bacterium]|jgi:aspartyl-tRNA(Asn)/glutamyl-tRNA(Gln) amidotransferase subunit C|nr:Asp-tRNA(Asn)/Glu-tRNA(Gln) amidotransferase subunit GatC [bacterium]
MTKRIEITKEEVIKISKLAKMNVDGEEERFAKLFTDTLNKIEILNELNTENIEETFQVTGLKNVYQEEPIDNRKLKKEEVFQNVKDKVKGLISTKGVFSGEENNES